MHLAGDLVCGAGKQLLQTVKGAGHIASTGLGCGTIDHQVVEIVGGSLDLLLCLECQLIHSARGVLQHTVHLEGMSCIPISFLI